MWLFTPVKRSGVGGRNCDREKHKARAKNFHKNLLESNETFFPHVCAIIKVQLKELDLTAIVALGKWKSQYRKNCASDFYNIPPSHAYLLSFIQALVRLFLDISFSFACLVFRSWLFRLFGLWLLLSFCLAFSCVAALEKITFFTHSVAKLIINCLSHHQSSFCLEFVNVKNHP